MDSYIKLKNVLFHFEVGDDEFLGDSQMTIQKSVLMRLLTENDHESIPYDPDHNLEEAVDEVTIYNSDAIIVLMSWMFDSEDEFEVEYCSTHPFWLYHDHFHALHDVAGDAVYVDCSIEEERLFQAGALHEKEMGWHFEVDEVDKIEQAFRTRWSYEFKGDQLLDVMGQITRAEERAEYLRELENEEV